MVQVKNIRNLHITKKHTGKMELFWSLSTSALSNAIYKKRKKNLLSICFRCYAMNFLSFRKNMQKVLKENYEILNQQVWAVEEMPELNPPLGVFRLESFGDIGSEVQFENYINLCLRNPHVTFAIWTKNPFIMKRVFKYREKPENMIIILSSPLMNQALNGRFYPFVDKVFTVYNLAGVKEKGIEINCQRKCSECMLCYKKNGVEHIAEILKSDDKKYRKMLENKEGALCPQTA